ncbi:hypothetical protein H4Q26_011013 [Puccinia striiformis f. sp. tritici PST-130]|nr:hypothetical protein H4Q26_011013 [Puccinia striiformis f. sp. tritici PST-130]
MSPPSGCAHLILRLSPSHNSPQHLNEVDHGALFGRDRNDDDLQINSSNLEDDNNIDRVCEDLQLKLKLDPAYLEIALHTAKCNPAARHANLIFANAAFQLIAAASAASASAQHKYDKCFDDLIRLNSLFYLTLDAVDCQSAEWKEEHLAPNQMDENFEGLDHYRTTVASNQRPRNRTDSDQSNVPHRNELMAILYADLPPQNEKMTKAQIQDQIKKNASQWADIDERLRVLRGSTPAFQQIYSPAAPHQKIITDEDVSVPSLDDVRAAMAAEATAAMAAESAAAMAAESTAP